MIAPLVTRGYGSWGGVNLVPTRGYRSRPPYVPPAVTGTVNWPLHQATSANHDMTRTAALNYPLTEAATVNVP